MKSISVNGYEVAQQIQTGRGYEGKGKLGGDPLRDVVLVEAMMQQNQNATNAFEHEYKDSSQQSARQSRLSFAADEDWWYDFLTGLVVGNLNTTNPGKLHSFRGDCALGNYLPILIRRFLYDRAIAARLITPSGHDKTNEDASSDVGGPPKPTPKRRKPILSLDDGKTRQDALPSVNDLRVITHDCQKYLRKMLRDILDSLEPTERSIFILLTDGRPKVEVARIVGKNQGTITRTDGRIKLRLKEKMEELSDESQKDLKDCWEHLLGTREWGEVFEELERFWQKGENHG